MSTPTLAESVADSKEVKKLRREWDQERKELDTEIQRLKDLLGLTDRVDTFRSARKIEPTYGKGDNHHGVVTSIFSDNHFDEVVRPEEIFKANKYNRKIATQRAERYFEKLVELPREYLTNITYDGAAIFMLGDHFSGDIHEELRRTNASEMAGSVAYWLDPVSAGIKLLADEYGHVTLDCVVGNHGRNPKDRYVPAKRPAESNIDYLLFALLERDFRGDERVEFNLALGSNTMRKIYDTSYLLTHGYEFKGGNAIAGLFSPLMLGHHRKAKRQNALGMPFDVMCLGHFHQYTAVPSQGLIINGSTKGYDEYAFTSNFGVEPAQQAMWVTTPEHGASAFHVPIIVQDRKREGW